MTESTAAVHNLNPTGECVFCCDDFSTSNYVEYQATANGLYLPSPYCQQCIEENFIKKQWALYLEKLSKADCAAALKRILSNPPPLNVYDEKGLPCKGDGSTGEVHLFWYSSDNGTHSAKLKDSLEGQERRDFWEDKKRFMTEQEILEENKKKQQGENGNNEMIMNGNENNNQ